MTEQDQIKEIEFKVKAIALREKYNSKKTISGAIKTAIEVNHLVIKAHQIQAQQLTEFKKGISEVGNNNKPEIII